MDIITTASKYVFTSVPAGTQPGHDRLLSKIQLTQVKGLIADGSDINTKERTGQEALHYAAMMGSAEITSLLIEAGAVRYQGIRHTHRVCQHQPHFCCQPSVDVIADYCAPLFLSPSNFDSPI